METWAWLAAYIVGFALLQVYLYLYFMRGRTTESSPERTPAGMADGNTNSIDSSTTTGDSERNCCGTCGTSNRNDQMFVFCKQCGQRLD